MDFDIWQLVVTFFAKLFGDTLGTMLGGGSLLVQPALIAVGVPAKLAVSHDLAAAAIGMISFLWFYRGHKISLSKQDMRWALLLMLPIAMICAVIGGHVMNSMSPDLLRLLVLVICCAGFVYSLKQLKSPLAIDRADAAQSPDERASFMPGWQVLLFISGAFIGFYDGIVGAGSGIVLLLLMVNVLRLDLKSAIPMANIIGAVSLSTATLTFLYLGLLRWELMLVMLPASIAAGALAAFLVRHIAEHRLRVLYSCALGLLCSYLIYVQFFTSGG